MCFVYPDVTAGVICANQMCGRQHSAGFAPLVEVNPETRAPFERLATCIHPFMLFMQNLHKVVPAMIVD
jgi:hypothetical protein